MIKIAQALSTGLIVICTVNLSCQEILRGNLKQNVASHECQQWGRIMSTLEQAEKDQLHREGALRKRGFGLILSDSLVDDCQLRTEIPEYMNRVLNGQSDKLKTDREFAARNSQNIVSVLRRLWPSLSNCKALVGDGNLNSEKYNLLADPALNDSDLVPLLADIIDTETIDNNLAWVLFKRPTPGTIPALLRQQESAEKADDYPWQILNLALLHKLGEPTALQRLKKLSRSVRLTSTEREYVSKLIMKAEHGEDIKFSDVEELESETAQ